MDTALSDRDIQNIAEALVLAMQEARGEYFYEEVTVKRWILGSGGRSGNCETCIDNADRGWIDMDDIFDSEQFEDGVDEPPAHFNCDCEIEWKDTRKRVYV